MDEKPLVSIVTPSFNQGKFIENTILSVKNQDYPRIEHIIVDAASTDQTLDILKRYEKQYNLTWISRPDNGQSDGINTGFSMAQGEIIGWLNSDDIYIYTNVITSVVDAFRNNPECDVIYGDSLVIDKDNYVMRTFRSVDWNYKNLLFVNFITQPSVFFRREVIAANKLDCEFRYCMDGEFWIRLGKKYRFHHLKKILSGDRYHPDTKRSMQQNWDDYNSESMLVREREGVDTGSRYRILHYVYSVYYTIYRRFIGIPDVFTLKKSGNFTVEIKFHNAIVRLFHQVLPWEEFRNFCIKIMHHHL